MAPVKGDQHREHLPNVSNPVRLVRFAAHDLGSMPPPSGSTKEHVPVTTALRLHIDKTLVNAGSALSPEWANHSGTPGILIFTVIDKCIAKSHRPLEVAAAGNLELAGHGNLNEMLVAANPGSIQRLSHIIRTKSTKAFLSDLSAIDHITAWDKKRRCTATLEELRERGSAFLRPFSFWTRESTDKAFNTLLDLLKSLDAQFIRMPQKRGPDLIVLQKLKSWTNERFDELIGFPSIKQFTAEPIVSSAATTSLSWATSTSTISNKQPKTGLPTIGLFDSGVANTALQLQPWIVTRSTYVLPPETDHVHGTALASLVALGKILNSDHPWFPATGCLIHDVAGMESTNAKLSDILLRLTQELTDHPTVKVWNLSIGAGLAQEQFFSDFAIAIDELSAKFGVLFVVSAGNYLDSPRRIWPDPTILNDRIYSPADAVLALSIGSVSHTTAPGQTVEVGSPAPYSRRGPGPVFTPKPDLVHVGGGVHAPWKTGDGSVKFLGPLGQSGRSFGTSYAAPLASCVAAHTWHSLIGGSGPQPTPESVKALMLHAAQLQSPDRSKLERRYYGSGLTIDAIQSLYDSNDCFTLMFEVELVDGQKWRKFPYPMPSSLMKNGKFKGEIIITATYRPPLDHNAGAEYVRANLELSFGTINFEGKMKGRVPLDGEEGQSGYEKAQIENGGKWSPVKQHRKTFPEGAGIGQWGLQANLRLRAGEPPLREHVRATIVVTLRSIDANEEVYAEGSRALTSTNWATNTLPVRVPIRT